MSEQSEKLYGGITHIRETLVEDAERGYIRWREKRQSLWKRRGLRAAAAVLALVFLMGTLLHPGSTSAYAIAEAEYPEEWQRQEQGYADGLESYFAVTMRQFLSGDTGENTVCSPLSIYMALAMLAEVTDGDSRRQILDLLGSDSIEALRQQASAVWNAQYRKEGSVTRTLGTSLWLNENVSFVQSTMDTLADTYFASSYRGEMGSAGFDRALRSWLNEQTGGLLEEQSKAITLDAETVLALATAVYYKAPWTTQFSTKRTAQGVFHGAAGDVPCDFMHQSGAELYYWGECFAAIRRTLEYGSMWFILPDEGYRPEDLLADDTVMEFLLMEGTKPEWKDQKHLIVNQAIPRFDVVSQIDLREGLQALGITDVFDPAVSDYTPMTADTDMIYLGKAQHDARVVIDEEGVEAAAYTVMGNLGAGLPPEEEVDFVADRPFLFVIAGADSLPLFAGVVNHP